MKSHPPVCEVLLITPLPPLHSPISQGRKDEIQAVMNITLVLEPYDIQMSSVAGQEQKEL